MTPNQTKQKQINELLEGGAVMVFLDARTAGVLVPERFRNEPDLKLNFDYAFRIPDFEVREDGVIATLSFSQTPYFCAIPMESIWQVVSLTSKKNYIYPESFPIEMIQDVLAQSKHGAPIPPQMVELLNRIISQPRPTPQMAQNPPRPKGFKPTLSVVADKLPAPLEELEHTPIPDDEPPPEPPKRAILRRIK